MSLYSSWPGGFIRSRQLWDNIRWICNIINYVQNKKIPTLLYICDVEKAFDRVQWNFLKEVLRRMGFGLPFMTWIDLIYFLQEADVKLEGMRSKKFPLYRRVREGCLLSPFFIECHDWNISISNRGTWKDSGFSNSIEWAQNSIICRWYNICATWSHKFINKITFSDGSIQCYTRL